MSRARTMKVRRGKKKNSLGDVDITSLLDILTILLVFLLQSYNSSGVIINVPREIKLPTSRSESLNNFGVNVQVSSTQIWVDDNEIINTTDPNKRSRLDQGDRRIVPLYDELVKLKEMVKQSEKLSPEVKKFSGVVNLVFDKTLKYSYLKKVMYTCGAAGYKEFKFVVMSEGN